MSLTSYIKSTLLIIIFYFLSIKTNFGSISSRKLLHFIWISLLFIFLPNLPLAISEKYQNATLVSYVTSDFVFIAALIFFLSIYFLIISFIKPKAIRNCIFILFGIFLFFISLIIQTSNEYFAHDASISHKRFETISTFLLNDEKIEDEDNIYIEPLHFTGSNSIADITFQGMPFKIYFKRVTGKEIYQYTSYSHFYNEFNESEDTVKLFFFSQAYHSGDSYIAMISCKGTELTEDWTQLKTSRIIVGYIASNKCFALTILSQNSFEVTIENQPLKNIENYHYANLFFRDLPKMCQFEISGEQLYPYTLSISNIIYQNLAPLKIGNLPLIYKTSILERKIEQIHSESEWLSLEKIKANERGISLDSMIKIDAKWVLEKWTWHSGQTE